eukprot:204907_1
MNVNVANHSIFEGKIQSIINEFKVDTYRQIYKNGKTFTENKAQLHACIIPLILPINVKTERKCKLLTNCDFLNILNYYGFYTIMAVLYTHALSPSLQKYIKYPRLVCSCITNCHKLLDSHESEFAALNYLISTNQLFAKHVETYTIFLCHLAIIMVERISVNGINIYINDKGQIPQFKTYSDILEFLFIQSHILLSELYPINLDLYINMVKGCLGYLCMFCSEHLYSIFRSKSRSEIEQLLLANGYDVYKGGCIKLSTKIKYWTCFNSVTYVSGLIKDASHYHDSKLIAYHNSEISNEKYPLYTHSALLSYMLSKICTSKQQYTFAKYDLIICAMLTDCFDLRILALKNLVINCYKNKEYLVGLKVLKYLLKLCVLNGEVIKSYALIYQKYSNYKQKLKYRWNQMRCVVCGESEATKMKMKCCMGCMQLVYCSKSCQKIHWNNQHRQNCHKSWQNHYEQLKVQLLDTI